MRPEGLEPSEYRNSVVAVPPVAWTADLHLNRAANAALIRHIEAGGIRILLYGGNANLYHFDLGRFGDLLDFLADGTASTTSVIASIGPDFGKMVDQVPILRDRNVRNVMVLPTAFPVRPAGIERGVSLIADSLGFGVILYVKQDRYIEAGRLERLVASGAVQFIKYAVERKDPDDDPYLADILSAVGRERVASGMGETPIHSHLTRYGVATFTSGGACLAPRATMAILEAYRKGDQERAEELRAPFLEFERVRASIDGFAVLHDGVTLSGIADMGPILPLLANLPDEKADIVRKGVQNLLEVEGLCRGADWRTNSAALGHELKA